MNANGPFTSVEEYLDCLSRVYSILKNNVRVNTKCYTQLIINCALINQYQTAIKGIPAVASVLYEKIIKLIDQEDKQEMLQKIGIYFYIEYYQDDSKTDFKSFEISFHILPEEMYKDRIIEFYPFCFN